MPKRPALSHKERLALAKEIKGLLVRGKTFSETCTAIGVGKQNISVIRYHLGKAGVKLSPGEKRFRELNVFVAKHEPRVKERRITAARLNAFIKKNMGRPIKHVAKELMVAGKSYSTLLRRIQIEKKNQPKGNKITNLQELQKNLYAERTKRENWDRAINGFRKLKKKHKDPAKFTQALLQKESPKLVQYILRAGATHKTIFEAFFPGWEYKNNGPGRKPTIQKRQKRQ